MAKKLKPTKKSKKEKIIGKAEHFYDKINVVTTTLKNPLKVGDIIHVKGHTTDFIQPIVSIQIEHESVQKAKKGNGIGIKVRQDIRDHDMIYLAGKKTISEFNVSSARQDNKINIIQTQPKIVAKPIELPKNNAPKFLSF